jgi:SAM-dependent methyltransferase
MTNFGQMKIFDRVLVRRHRNRVGADFALHNVLFEEVAAQLIERLSGIKQEFHSVLDLGAHDGLLARHFAENGASFAIAADISETMLKQKDSSFSRIVADEEMLPFAPGSFDLVVSNLSLHWVNDVPDVLMQIKKALRPGGLFLASLIGGGSLIELRTCLMEAELATTGGASPRLSPSIDMPTASALLQRAGFNLPVTDQENITLEYADAFALMRDLRGMGETNALIDRLRRPTRRRVFTEMARLYRERFGAAGGKIAASFEIVFLHGRSG